MKRTIYTAVLPVFIIIAGCSRNDNQPDAYGNFEAREITVSAEAHGRILSFPVEEGDCIDQGESLGWIDTTDLSLKLMQLRHQKAALVARFATFDAQMAVHEQQIVNLQKDKTRFDQMLKEGAATPKQVDDIEAGILLANRQAMAIKAQYATLEAEIAAMREQIRQVEEGLKRCRIVSPAGGSILVKYLSEGELAPLGKPLFRLANLDELILRAYVSGSQLHKVSVGQQVKVYADAGRDQLMEFQGTITWIAAEAEFTPKVIQTREERVNLVYAIKVSVKNNDGSLKIGMPGEVRF